MEQNQIVLCGSNAYERKYYFNPDFSSLPKSIQDELKIMCVMFTEEIGGILTLQFEEDGTLVFCTEAKDSDYSYDEIGGALKIKEYREDKKELFESLEMFYKVFYLGDEFSDLLSEDE